MGFDLYGLSPQKNIRAPKEVIRYQNGEEYFIYKGEHENRNPGEYFRANVWYWRPLWQYVTVLCDNILTVEDMEKGEYNDGHKISKTKANRIASRLKKANKNGEIMEYELLYKQNIDSLPKVPCDICEGTGMRNDDLGKEARKENPEYNCNSCYGEGKKDNFNSHYPFESEEVMRFAEFCEQSGGFEIC